MTTDRLEALDVFRGLTVAAMILVSTPGDWNAVYAPLDHAAWNGWTPTDLVFPFFLFAMGAAVPIALSRRRTSRRPIRHHVIRRALILFALGLVLNALNAKPPLSWTTFRLPGVLQRIAVVYVAIVWITERLTRRAQAAVAVSLLLGYWLLMTIVPVPGVGGNVLTPEGNLASFIDRALLGRHLAFGTWDPEGILSTLPAIATALCGVFAGNFLIAPSIHGHRSLRLWAAGAAATVMGLTWGVVFPLNKSLWTSSFALFSAGMATQVIAICHWVLDVQKWKGWAVPLLAFGRNALAAYFLSIFVDSVLTRWQVFPRSTLKWELYSRLFEPWIERCCSAEMASLSYALAYVALWATIVVIMYRRRVFIGI